VIHNRRAARDKFTIFRGRVAGTNPAGVRVMPSSAARSARLSLLALRALAAFGVVAATTLAAGCSAADVTDDDEEEGEMSEGELRARSEDLFKPTSAPVQVIPSTLRNLLQWELYSSQKGTTVIGRSRTKKAKAIFVQLIDRNATSQRASIRGSGYLVASDFRLDARNKKRELELLAEAIRKDFASSIQAPPASPDPEVTTPSPSPSPSPSPAPTPAPSSDPPVEPTPTDPAAPDPEATPAAPPAPAPVATVEVKPCARSIVKSVIWGVDLLKDTVSVVANGVQCPVSKDACGSAVASFTHGIALIEKFDEQTCKTR
jgi:hypothetical protein